MFGKSWAPKRPDKIIPQIYDAITDSLAFARIICGVVVQMSWINNNTSVAMAGVMYVFFSLLSALCTFWYGLSSTICTLAHSFLCSYRKYAVESTPPLIHSVSVAFTFSCSHDLDTAKCFSVWCAPSSSLSHHNHRKTLLSSSVCAYTYRHNKTVKHWILVEMREREIESVHQILIVYRLWLWSLSICCCFSYLSFSGWMYFFSFSLFSPPLYIRSDYDWWGKIKVS